MNRVIYYLILLFYIITSPPKIPIQRAVKQLTHCIQNYLELTYFFVNFILLKNLDFLPLWFEENFYKWTRSSQWKVFEVVNFVHILVKYTATKERNWLYATMPALVVAVVKVVVKSPAVDLVCVVVVLVVPGVVLHYEPTISCKGNCSYYRNADVVLLSCSSNSSFTTAATILLLLLLLMLQFT